MGEPIKSAPLEKPWGVELPNFKRLDGREGNFHLRPPRCELGLLKNANGSARFQMGLTSVLAAVYGPKESTGSRRFAIVDRGCVQVVVRPLSGNSTLLDKYSEACVTEVLLSLIELERLIRTTVTVILQPETDDGGILSCLLNATMCALLDAGVPLKSTYFTVPMAQLKQSCSNQIPHRSDESSFLLDPAMEEIYSPESIVDSSTFIACTIDIHTGTVIQVVPEYTRLFQQGNIDTKTHNFMERIQSSEPISTQWGLTLKMITIAGTCCKIFSELVRKSLELRLNKLVVKTFKANNFMELPV